MAFISKWIRQDNNDRLSDRIKDTEKKSNMPLKPRLDDARKMMQVQIIRLDTIHKKLSEKDRILFNKVIQAIQERNMQYASILSNELTQIRKISKMVNHVKLALEQIQLRLSTISDLGDVVVTLSPAMAVVKSIRQDLGKVMPEFDGRMQEMYDMFNSIMIDTAQASNNVIHLHTALSSDAQSILEEATNLVEDSIKAKLPDLPQEDITLPEIRAETIMNNSYSRINNSSNSSNNSKIKRSINEREMISY